MTIATATVTEKVIEKAPTTEPASEPTTTTALDFRTKWIIKEE